jgi:spore germination protein GerM
MIGRLRLLAVTAAVAVGCVSCGIPTSPDATVFNAPADAAACTGPQDITIYLIGTVGNRDRLAPVRRSHVARPGDAAECAINALNAGPTSDEVINGLSTAFVEIPEGLTYVGTTKDVATVQLDARFLSIAQPAKIAEAYAQIVYTLTGLGVGINKVQFIFDNGPFLGVLLPNGTAAPNGITTRQDYCALAPAGQRCGSSGANNTATSGSSG